MASCLVNGCAAAKDLGEVLRTEHSGFDGVETEGSSGKSSVASLAAMQDRRLPSSVCSSVESDTDVVIRDPEAMMRGLITCGVAPADGVRVLVEYYKAKAVKVVQPDIVSVSSRQTTRDLRVQKWREDMEALPQEYGYCYLNVVRYSHRPHLKKALGCSPTMQQFLALLRFEDLDMNATRTFNVYRFPGRARFEPCYHVARECDKGDAVGTFYQVLVTMLRLYPFLNTMQLDRSGCMIGDLPLVGNVGLVPTVSRDDSVEQVQEYVDDTLQQQVTNAHRHFGMSRHDIEVEIQRGMETERQRLYQRTERQRVVASADQNDRDRYRQMISESLQRYLASDRSSRSRQRTESLSDDLPMNEVQSQTAIQDNLQRDIDSQTVVEHMSPDLPLLFTELPLNRSPEYTAIETGEDNEELGPVSLDTKNFHFNMEYSLSHLCSEGYMDICQDFAIFEHIPMNVRTYNRLDPCEPLGNGIHVLVLSPLSLGWLMDDERERQAKWPLALIVAPDLFQGLCKQLLGIGPVTVLNYSGWLESDIQRTLLDIGYSPMAVNTLNVNIGCVYHTLHEEYQYTVTDLDEHNIISGVIYRYTQISFDERGYFVPYIGDLSD